MSVLQLERISDTEELEVELQQDLVEQEAKDMLHSPHKGQAGVITASAGTT